MMQFSTMKSEIESGSVRVEVDCRYLLRGPESGQARLLVVALHGYGSTPEAMLRLMTPLVDAGDAIVSLQAPFQHYLSPTPGGADTGYNWGVREHHADAIRIHHTLLLDLLGRLRTRFELQANRCVLAGFSQPVGLNYRFVATHPRQAGGVIGLCGGVPRDWEENKYEPVTARILHISRSEDEFFPQETAMGFGGRLRFRASDVEFHMLPGAHRFPSKAAPMVQQWLARLAGG